MSLSKESSDALIVAGLRRCLHFNGFLVDAFRCDVAETVVGTFSFICFCTCCSAALQVDGCSFEGP